jgi:hypothetical protein
VRRRLAYDIHTRSPIVWVVDKGSSLLTKIDGTNPNSPTLVSQIDLSAYSPGGKRVRVNNGNVFVASVIIPTAPTTTPVIIVNAISGSIVGLASVNTGGDTEYGPKDYAFDGAGNVWVLAYSSTTSVSDTIYQYSIADILAAFPSTYATPIAKFIITDPIAPTDGGQLYEQIAYGSGFLWIGTGSANANYSGKPILLRVDPGTGATTYYRPLVSGTINNFWGVMYAFGSVWATSGNTNNSSIRAALYRFDPNTWPADPIATITVPNNSHTKWSSSDMIADSSTIWFSNGSAFPGASYAELVRVSTGLGSEAIIADVIVSSTTSSIQGLAWNGRAIWGALRYGTNSGLASFSTTLGSESYIQTFNPLTPFVDPISVGN